MIQKYKNVFFDLDRTLWDFETNSKQTINDLFLKYNLNNKIDSFENFYKTYEKVNEKYWDLYRKGKISKQYLRTNRFYSTLKYFNIDDFKLSDKFGLDYIKISPKQTNLFPNTIEILEYLQNKYNLYIITNGFKEVQFVKLKNTNLYKYFKKVFTSEMIGVQKPNSKFFEYSIKHTNSKKDESIVVGDDLNVDIIGARNFGLDQIYFNPKAKKHNEKITFEINNLIEIKDIL